MHDGLVVKGVAGIICAAALAACSVWLNTDERQCRTDSDCITAKLGTVCVQQVCMDTATESSACGRGGCDAATGTETSASEVTNPCESDEDCAGKTPRCLNKGCVDAQTGDRWLCPPTDQPVKNSSVRFNFHVVDFLTRTPPKSVVAKACRNNDVACAEPVDTFTDTDQSGHVQLMLPTGFVGFFEVKSAAIDTLLYITRPIVRNTLSRDLPVPTVEAIGATASLLGYPYEMEKGLALIEALDCSDTPQGGIHFDSREGGNPFYLIDQTPNKDTLFTVYDEVNNSANGGFINVPPGFVQFSARVGLDGLQLGSFNAQIRPRTITFIDMHF
jgi:hypothetical protein